MNSEKFYVQLLSQTIRTYLTNLPDEIQHQLNVFLQTIRDIYDFHANTFYPKLKMCEAKLASICEYIRGHVSGNDFSIYNTYAAFANEARQLIQENSNENVSFDRFVRSGLLRW